MIYTARPSKSRFASLIAVGLLAAAAVAAPEEANAQQIQRSNANPDYHVVSSGDTMWDLSGSYYNDQYNWPRLWGYNAHVTNPHWIYPGDILYLKPPRSTGDPRQTEQVADTGRTPGMMMLPAAGFITTEKIEYVGRIVASEKEANMLSPLDRVWVEFGEEAEEEGDPKMRNVEAREGDLFAVVRELEDVKGDDTTPAGTKYVVVGALRVESVSEKYYDTAVVTNSWREMYRGDYLIPYERQLKAVQPVRADTTLVAKIVDSMAKLRFFGEQHYVFVNKGAEDGVRVGNRMFIYQKREGLTPIGKEPHEKVPWRQVGQLVVLDVRQNFSLAVITDSSREIEIGDRLEMYSGN